MEETRKSLIISIIILVMTILFIQNIYVLLKSISISYTKWVYQDGIAIHISNEFTENAVSNAV